MRLAVAAIARPTFDVPFAEQTAAAAVAALDAAGHELIGDATLLMETAAVTTAARDWSGVDAVVVLQATFADSTLAMAAANSADAPLHLWGFPEERTGGRLRLNSLCGINLAAFALRTAGHDFTYAYAAPSPAAVDELLAAATEPAAADEPPHITSEHRRRAAYATGMLGNARIGVIGDHPGGFEPCAYDPGRLQKIGPVADRIELDELFAAGDAATADELAAIRFRAEGSLGSLLAMPQDALDRSLRIGVGLDNLARARNWSAVATRCWPECFTEYGGAVCSPHAMLGDSGIPGMCEADAYGGVTALVLQWLTGGPAFVADLVELSADTGVFWHCGNAPTSMAAGAAAPTVHSNRHMPLLGEFLLRPGIMTVCRVSQSAGQQRLVVGLVEALDAPLPFSGTSAVVRFQKPILPTVMTEGLEHHYGLAYGDVTAELYALAEGLGIDVVAL